jgi:hypothetical protein
MAKKRVEHTAVHVDQPQLFNMFVSRKSSLHPAQVVLASELVAVTSIYKMSAAPYAIIIAGLIY